MLRMPGRVVQNFAQPLQDYVPEEASLFRGVHEELNKTTLGAASRFAKSSIKKAVRGTFLSLVQGQLDDSTTRESWLQTTAIHAYELRRQPDVFERLKRQPQIVSKIREWKRLQDIPGYMIVGVLVWETAKIVQIDESAHSASGKVNLPTALAGSSAIAATTGVVVDPAIIGDVGGSGSRERSSQLERTADIAESKIFAVQCLNIRSHKPSFFSPASYELGAHGPRIPDDRKYGEVGDVGKEAESDREILEIDAGLASWTDIIYEFDEDTELESDVVEFEQRRIRIACDMKDIPS